MHVKQYAMTGFYLFMGPSRLIIRVRHHSFEAIRVWIIVFKEIGSKLCLCLNFSMCYLRAVATPEVTLKTPDKI